MMSGTALKITIPGAFRIQPEDGLHGPGGDLMIELDALPAGAVADRRPLLLYLEYE